MLQKPQKRLYYKKYFAYLEHITTPFFSIDLNTIREVVAGADEQDEHVKKGNLKIYICEKRQPFKKNEKGQFKGSSYKSNF